LCLDGISDGSQSVPVAPVTMALGMMNMNSV
jgi:hypothetical protein